MPSPENASKQTRKEGVMRTERKNAKVWTKVPNKALSA